MAKAVAKEWEPQLTPGEWYLRYTCISCRTKHVLFRDLTQGVGHVRATYLIQCPTCHTREVYEGENIERYHYLENDPRDDDQAFMANLI